MRIGDTVSRTRLLGAGIVMLATVILVVGCASVLPGSSGSRLSQAEALRLAVDLANQECQSKFSRAPFDSATSAIRRVGDRWSWGGLDLAGPGGLSAEVSFDERGGDRRVEVYLSADYPRMLYGDEPMQ